MDFLNLQLEGGSTSLNFNSVEILPGYEARASFLCSGKALRGNPINSASVFKEDVDIVPTIVDDTLSYVPWGGERFFTDKEVSARLKVSRRTLQDYRNEGRIPYPVGRQNPLP